jgi:hypothetical protein
LPRQHLPTDKPPRLLLATKLQPKRQWFIHKPFTSITSHPLNPRRVAFLLPLCMAEFMQINLATAPVLLNLKDVKFVSSSATNTITLYYSATDEATVTFSAADATYGLQNCFVGQVKVAISCLHCPRSPIMMP